MEKIVEKILLVDENRKLLDTHKNQLCERFNLLTATSSADALQAITDAGPIAVVITDAEMPNMDGMELLTQVRIIAPNTVRILLADQISPDLTITAVNQCNIYRMLIKPVGNNVLQEAIIDAIQQYRLITAEKMLLKKTLKGVVELLAEILSLINPTAASQATRIKGHVRQIARKLSLKNIWDYELAAMMSQLGYATLPKDLIEKLGTGLQLSTKEREMLHNHPKVGGQLLKHIPLLSTPAKMIERQTEDIENLEVNEPLTADARATLGGQILRVVIGYDNQIKGGESPQTAIEFLKNDPASYDPALVYTLALGDSDKQKVECLSLPLEKLETGMILDQSIRSKAGALLMSKGQEIDTTVKMRLLLARESGIISGTFKVIRIF
ncbi:MAG: response regulator [Gammaproteobacteria bacterium]|nr:response regulator [Gammaproteobacteria bacterium]